MTRHRVLPTLTRALLTPAAALTLLCAAMIALAPLAGRAMPTEVVAVGMPQVRSALTVWAYDLARLTRVRQRLPLRDVLDIRQIDSRILIATGWPDTAKRTQRLYLYDPRRYPAPDALTLIHETQAPASRAYGLEDYAPSFAPDGGQIALVDPASGDIRVHTLATGQTRTLLTGGGYMQALSWSPDGAQLATRIEGALVVVDVRQGEAVRWPTGMAGRAFVPNWAEDGRSLLLNAFGAVMTGQGPPMRVIDAQTGQVNRLTEALYGFNGALGCDGQRLAYLADAGQRTGQSVRLLDLTTGQERDLSALPLLADRLIYGLRWLPACQGLLVYALPDSGGVTSTAYFFVTPDGRAAETIAEVAWAATQDDGSVIYPQAMADGSIMLYRALPGGLRGPFGTLSGQTGGLNALSGQVMTRDALIYRQGDALLLARLDGSPPLVLLRGGRLMVVLHWRL